jgi:hypothetical protein
MTVDRIIVCVAHAVKTPLSSYAVKSISYPRYFPVQNSWRMTLSYIPAPYPAHHIRSNDIMRGARIVDITVVPYPSFPALNVILW